MADKSLRYVVSAVDKNAGKTIGDVAKHGSKAAATIGSAFGKLSGVLGGEVGELASKLQEHFDQLGEHGGHGLAAKLEVGGAAMLGIGASLTAMGDAEKQSTDQLRTAVDNAGGSFEALEPKVESAVGHMEKYGYTAIQTKDALTKLTNATQDPAKAIGLMGEAADLAASRHITLASASDMLSKTINGSTRLYKLYGIQVQTNADGTKNLTGAQERLAQILHGQADAAANNFTGKLRQLRAEVEDNVAAFGQKYGPALTATGAGMLILTPILKGAGSAVSALASKFRGAGVAAEDAAATTVAADEEIVAGNEEAAASAAAAGAAEKGRSLSSIAALGGLTLGIAAVGLGASELTSKTDAAFQGMESSIKSDDEALTRLLSDVVNGKGSFEQLADGALKAALSADGLADKAAAAGITVEDLVKAIQGGAGPTAKLAEEWKKSGAPSGATLVQLASLADKYGETKKKTDETTDSAKKQTVALNPLATKLGITNSALATAQQQAKKTADSNKANTLAMQLENNAAGLLSAAFDKLNGRTLNVEQSHIAFRNAEASVTSSIKDNGKALGDNTEKGRANRSAVLDAISAAQQHAQAIATQTGSTVKATAAYQEDIGALRRHLLAIGLDKDQVQRLIDKYGQIPPLKTTKLTVKDEASSDLRNIQSYLHGLAYGVTVPVRVQKSGIGNEATASQGHAGGSDFFSGGRTLIAEREPEIVDLPRGSTITPLSKIGRGGSGGQTVQVNVNLPATGLYSAEAARYFVSHLEQWLRSGGGIKGITY